MEASSLANVRRRADVRGYNLITDKESSKQGRKEAVGLSKDLAQGL